MTESEAKGFIQGKLDCMKKCGVFNKEDIKKKDLCDYCDYCYSQGNFGEQKEVFAKKRMLNFYLSQRANRVGVFLKMNILEKLHIFIRRMKTNVQQTEKKLKEMESD